ncbi:hypothetical protein PV08_09764 [Exophiala spinifera]|uniref:Xylanolytic transcriptional activator regulatory domain-containing protein n=1 Tax=Exophiala spinifera TaxID=91928 RepID=A0A0D1ZHX0_9EURO|nr:uncharacterized protein PV08_09764 [Exophiala spinifera]KIW12487.1 hypothetical protein PV08_09764 [Exophiala spinifera]
MARRTFGRNDTDGMAGDRYLASEESTHQSTIHQPDWNMDTPDNSILRAGSFEPRRLEIDIDSQSWVHRGMPQHNFAPVDDFTGRCSHADARGDSSRNTLSPCVTRNDPKAVLSCSERLNANEQFPSHKGYGLTLPCGPAKPDESPPSNYSYSRSKRVASSSHAIASPIVPRSPPKVGNFSCLSYSAFLEDDATLLPEPETRPISQEQLVNEVKGIYAGLVMVEKKCVEICQQQSQTTNKLSDEQWQALIALHRTLLHEHHDFFLASQHPTASLALRRLPTKYAMPARMWRHGIHSFLELLRPRLPPSLEHMLSFVYLAYQMMGLLMESVPAFHETWIECLGDLARYRMAIEEADIRDRERWSNTARMWYNRAADHSPTTGRIQHHLAVLARPNIVRQLFYYSKALISDIPFVNARDSIMLLFSSFLDKHEKQLFYNFKTLPSTFPCVNTRDLTTLLASTSFQALSPASQSYIQKSTAAYTKFDKPLTSDSMMLLIESLVLNSDVHVIKSWKVWGPDPGLIASIPDFGSEENLRSKGSRVYSNKLQTPTSKRCEVITELNTMMENVSHPRFRKHNTINLEDFRQATLPGTAQTHHTSMSTDEVTSHILPGWSTTRSIVADKVGDRNILPYMHMLLAYLLNSYISSILSFLADPLSQSGQLLESIALIWTFGSYNQVKKNKVPFQEPDIGDDRPENLSTPLSASDAATDQVSGPPRPASHVETPISAAPLEDRTRDDLVRRLQTLENLFSTSHLEQLEAFHSTPPLQRLKDGRALLNKTRVYGRSHWTSTVCEFKWTTLRLFLTESHVEEKSDNEEVKALKSEMRAMLQKCKVLARSSKVARPSRCFSCPELTNLARLPRDTSDLMANLYLSKFETSFRILHVPSFLAEYDQYWTNPSAAPADLKLKVQLVIAIGSSISHKRSASAEIRSMASHWIYAAQNWLAGPLEKDRFSISGLQVHCLLILARQILCVAGDLIWVSMGTLLRTAMQMGLHRDPDNFPKMCILQAEIRRRLWATILEYIVQSSLDSGMPPLITFEDFDTTAPANIDDEEINEHTKVLPQHPRSQVTATSAQLVLLDSCRSRMKAVRCMNGLGSKLLYDEVLALSADISNACQVSLAYTSKLKSAPFSQNMNDLLLRRFLLPLHRLFANKANTNPLFYFSKKTCLDCVMAFLSSDLDEDFSQILRSGGGFLKGGILYMFFALGIEVVQEFQEEGIKNAQPHRQWLINALDKAIELAVDRLRLGETNVKMHLMLNMIQAQIQPSDNPTELSLRLGRKGLEALQTSYNILQANAAPSHECSVNETDMTFFDTGQDTSMSLDYRFDDLLMNTDMMDGMFENCAAQLWPQDQGYCPFV